MRNQWGQDIEVDDIVAYVNRTGSYTERKLGIVLAFGSRNEDYGSQHETTVRVQWVWDGSYGLAEERRHRGTVGLRRVVKVDPATLHDYIREGLLSHASTHQ
jgi:hypothetical protein